jgi:uncharacterized protein (TIGR03067 family)
MQARVLAAVAVGLVIGVGGVGGTQAKDDPEKIQGTWEVVSVEDNGRKAPDDKIKDAQFIIAKDKLTVVHGDKMKEIGTFKLDPSKKPGWIDMTESGGKTMLGIYELKGDTLKMCFNEKAGGERPTQFVSMADSPNDLLFVLKREKK